jgi:hypothetical protein
MLYVQVLAVLLKTDEHFWGIGGQQARLHVSVPRGKYAKRPRSLLGGAHDMMDSLEGRAGEEDSELTSSPGSEQDDEPDSPSEVPIKRASVNVLPESPEREDCRNTVDYRRFITVVPQESHRRTTNLVKKLFGVVRFHSFICGLAKVLLV